ERSSRMNTRGLIVIGLATLGLACGGAASGQVLEKMKLSRSAAATGDASPPSKTGLKVEDGYRLKAGPFKVETTDLLVLHDSVRDKDLELLVRVPTGAAGEGKKLPVVIFSHGM